MSFVCIARDRSCRVQWKRVAPLPLLVASLLAVGCGSSHVTDTESDAGPIVFDLDGARFPDVPPEPDASRESGNVGAACTSGADCTGAADTCIPSQPGFLPGGYCTTVCEPDDDASCPTNSTCIEVSMGQAFCFLSCDPTATERQCRDGYGCASGIALGANVCVGGCSDADDCGSGQACDPRGGDLGAGACFTEGAAIGDSCVDATACPAGGTCQSESATGWPGGACLGGSCDVATNSGCTGSDACLPTVFGGGGVCVHGCAIDDDCRDGYACIESTTPGRMYCAPACETDAGCTIAGNVCNAGAGTCAPPFVDGRLGGTCSFREACVGGTCLREQDSGFPSGYCAYQGCELGTSGTCPNEGVCAPRSSRNVCLDACASDTDCRTGYACRPSNPDDGTSPTACVPACTTEAHCPSRSTTCNVESGYCVSAG